jgi:hypothetical protein
MPQQQRATPDDDPAEARELAGSVPPRVFKTHRLQPEFRFAVTGSDVDVRRLPYLLILVGIEVEPIGTETVNGRHAHLAAMVGETTIMATRSALSLIQ